MKVNKWFARLVRQARGGLRRSAVAVGVVLGICGASSTAAAQSTGTNTVTLLADNITNASNTLIPIVISISIVLLVWGFARKMGRRAG